MTPTARFARLALVPIGILLIVACAGQNTLRHTPAFDMACPAGDRPSSSFAFQIDRSPDDYLVAWGSVVSYGNTSKIGWVLMANKEVVSFLVEENIAPDRLLTVGDNSNWSPYHKPWPSEGWMNCHFITSFEMPAAQYCAMRKCPRNQNGIPVIERLMVDKDLDLLQKLVIKREIVVDGFILP